MYLGDEDYEIDGARVFPGQRNVFAAAFGTTLPTPDTPTAYAGPGATPGSIVAGWSPVASDGEIRAYLVVPDSDFSAATWVPAPANVGELRGLAPGSGHTVSVYALSRYGMSGATDVVAYAADGDLPPLGPGNNGPTGGTGQAGGRRRHGRRRLRRWLLDGHRRRGRLRLRRSPPPRRGRRAAVDLEPTPTGNGYWMLERHR